MQRRDDLLAQTIRLALLAQPQHARHLARLRVGGYGYSYGYGYGYGYGYYGYGRARARGRVGIDPSGDPSV